MASSFLSRWSQRKLDENRDDATVDEPASSADVDEVLVSQDTETVDEEPMPLNQSESEVGDVLESDQQAQPHSEELSVSQLLANPEVDKAIKKAALRKMFMSPEFNVVDGLNDYDHDYSAVKPLASDVAETLRGWMKHVSDDADMEQSAEVDEHPQEVDNQDLASHQDAESEEVDAAMADPDDRVSEASNKPV